MAVNIEKTIVELDAKLSDFDRKFDATAARLDKNTTAMGKSVKNVEDSIERFTGISGKRLLQFSGAIVAALSVRQLQQYSDAWTTIQNKLKAALDPTVDLVETNERLLKVANDTRSSLDSTATLFSRVSRNTEELNRTQEENLRLTELINKSFTLSGATAQEASAAIIQLSQAFASGRLAGDEFRSVSEQAPVLLEAITTATGKTRGELKELAAQQLLTTDILITSIENYADVIDSRFARTQATFSQSLEIGENNLISLIGQLDDAAGITDAAGANFVGLTEKLLAMKEPLLGLIDTLDVWGDRIDDVFGKRLERALDQGGDTFDRQLMAMASITRVTADFLADAFIQFPENVEAGVRIAVAAIVTLLKEAELKLVELRQAFNIFVGDDEEAALLDARRRELTKDVELNRIAKDAFINDTLERRQAAIDSFAAQVEAARELREETAKGGGEGAPEAGQVVDLEEGLSDKEATALQKQLDAIDKRQDKLRKAQQTELEILNERISKETDLLEVARENELLSEVEFNEKLLALEAELQTRKEELALTDLEKLEEKQTLELEMFRQLKQEQFISEEEFQTRLTALVLKQAQERVKLAEKTEKAKASIAGQGFKTVLGLLNAFAGQNEKIGKAIFLFEQIKAANEVFVKTKVASATIAAQLGVAAGPAIAANEARGAISIAAILATTIAGLSTGGGSTSGGGGDVSITTTTPEATAGTDEPTIGVTAGVTGPGGTGQLATIFIPVNATDFENALTDMLNQKTKDGSGLEPT